MKQHKQLISKDGKAEYHSDQEVLDIISENNPNFVGLDLQNKLADYDNTDLCSAISRNTHITSINLDYNRDVIMQNFINIIEVVKKNQSIKSLDFGGCLIDLSVAKAIASLMNSNKTIDYIELEICSGIGQEGILEIAKAVGKNTTIECLGITEIGLNNDSANLFISYLRHNRNIIKLNSKVDLKSSPLITDEVHYSEGEKINPKYNEFIRASLSLRNEQSSVEQEDDMYYDDDKNIDAQLNNSIRALILRNNQYSVEQRKFFTEIKDDLIAELKINEERGVLTQDDNETSDRVLEVVNDVMDKLSDNSILKKIRDLFLVSKSLSHLPIGILSEEASIKIIEESIKLFVKNPDFMMDSSEIKVVSNGIYKYFNSKKESTLKALIEIPHVQTQTTSGITLARSAEGRAIN